MNWKTETDKQKRTKNSGICGQRERKKERTSLAEHGLWGKSGKKKQTKQKTIGRKRENRLLR